MATKLKRRRERRQRREWENAPLSPEGEQRIAVAVQAHKDHPEQVYEWNHVKAMPDIGSGRYRRRGNLVRKVCSSTWRCIDCWTVQKLGVDHQCPGEPWLVKENP